MRIIAGEFRSRRLRSLRGADLRPTSDRLRETLFAVLTASRLLQGSVWLDLFAGTGAVGIEALSRGASQVYFVEQSREAVALIRANLASLGMKDRIRILQTSAVAGIQKFSGLKFDICFLDPPYRMEAQYALVLEALAKSSLLKAGSVVVAEHSKHFDPPAEIAGLARSRKLVQGDAVLSFYSRKEEQETRNLH
jgi:16S rRNA (guanine(966)-N(2))-methyltransferase RsmD